MSVCATDESLSTRTRAGPQSAKPRIFQPPFSSSYGIGAGAGNVDDDDGDRSEFLYIIYICSLLVRSIANVVNPDYFEIV